jgi:DNA sulfur modification protein DndC
MSDLKVSKSALAERSQRIQQVYLADQIPWVVGYSGGKDSTATLQLVWYAVKELPAEKRHKVIHVISTDTLVESPVVALWVTKSLELMRLAAAEQGLPIKVHRLTPKAEDSYWVNLIGRGYPAPRQNFRWCTNRLKIEPSNRFVLDVVKESGEAIMVLGTRSAESSVRAANMAHHAERRTRQWLSPNASLPNSLVFTPIEDWSNDEVWMYLMQYRNPWERSNKDLLGMYRGASADNECPLVVDTSSPSCGNSRFGCWVCTLVAADKSMEAMIHNDEEKRWMQPMLELRNEIARPDEDGKIDDFEIRDFRRMDKKVKLFRERDDVTIHGPYLKEKRQYWLRRLLEVEKVLQETGLDEVRGMRLISDEELREIRRIWVEDKHEFEDALPNIYEAATGKPYPFMDDLAQRPFGPAEWDLLKEVCGENPLFLELQGTLLDLQQQNRGLISRKGMIENLERAIRGAYYENEQDALAFHHRRQQVKSEHEQQMHFALTQEGMDIDDLPND